MQALFLKYKLLSYGIAFVILAAAFLTYRHSLIQTGIIKGRAETRILWEKDTKSRDLVASQVTAKYEADKATYLSHNTQVLADANTQLISIVADRDGLSRLYLQARDQIRSLSSRAATDKLGVDVAAGIAASAAALEEAYDAYDAACRRDAVRFAALQTELLPQL